MDLNRIKTTYAAPNSKTATDARERAGFKKEDVVRQVEWLDDV